MSQKSRHQSLYDFLECLQLEYVSAELRNKIYSSNNDKRYYKRVMGYKREKIDDIALRNDIPTIFTDTTNKRDIYYKMYVKGGIPEFVYKNDSDRDKFEESDLFNYFAVGGEVKIVQEDGEGFDVGIIVDNEQLAIAWTAGQQDLSNIPIAVKKRNQDKDSVALISQLSRIL